MINLIACVDKNYGIGKNNKLLFNIKEDMEFFKKTTMGETVVMGFNTYKSLNKPLEGRENLVIVDNIEEIKLEEGFNAIDQGTLATMTNHFTDKKYFVIGGESIYKRYIDYADVLYLTHVEDEGEADKFFPQFNLEDYKSEVIKSSEDEDGTEFVIIKYIKKDEVKEKFLKTIIDENLYEDYTLVEE